MLLQKVQEARLYFLVGCVLLLTHREIELRDLTMKFVGHVEPPVKKSILPCELLQDERRSVLILSYLLLDHGKGLFSRAWLRFPCFTGLLVSHRLILGAAFAFFL